jgi:hypothetical protein
LHIDAYHNKINNRKKKRNSALKIPTKNYKNYKKNSKEKQLIYLKKEKRGNGYITSTQRTHAKFEGFKRQVKPELNEKCK